ncbi:S8 family serine peptidase [Citrobacter freundii]|uniref:S8 family serine peptidase n=1 Tax=Citrobacter freundii TaxID=546 RepID=UPI000764AC45|nr:hypothetical protein [Citrobacter freundii]
MKKITLFMVFFLTSCTAHNEQKTYENTERVIVTYSEGSKATILADASRAGLPVVYELNNMNIVVLSIPEKNAEQAIKRLESLDGVLGVQKDRKEVSLQ